MALLFLRVLNKHKQNVNAHDTGDGGLESGKEGGHGATPVYLYIEGASAIQHGFGCHFVLRDFFFLIILI